MEWRYPKNKAPLFAVNGTCFINLEILNASIIVEKQSLMVEVIQEDFNESFYLGDDIHAF